MMSFSASVVGFSVEVSGEGEAASRVLLLMLGLVVVMDLKKVVDLRRGRERDRQRLEEEEEEEGEEGVDGGRRQAMLEGVMTTSRKTTRRIGMACSCRACCGCRSGVAGGGGSDEDIAGPRAVEAASDAVRCWRGRRRGKEKEADKLGFAGTRLTKLLCGVL